MARALQNTLDSAKNELFTPDELLSHLVEAEWDESYNRKMHRNIQRARFRYKASIELLNYDDNRLNKNQVVRLSDCEFVKRKENIIITGSTGIGKSFLASALGHQACGLGYKVLYYHNTKLFAKMKLSKTDGSYLKELSRIENTSY